MPTRKLLISLIGIIVLAVGGIIGTVATNTTPKLGLDLEGGFSVIYQPVNGPYTDSQLEQARNSYFNRADSLGVSEPEVVLEGGKIIVNLPGVEDQDRAAELIGATGKLLLRPTLNRSPFGALKACASSAEGTDPTPQLDLFGSAEQPAPDPQVIQVGTDSTVPGSVPDPSSPESVPASPADSTATPAPAAPSETVAPTAPAAASSVPGAPRAPRGADTTAPPTTTSSETVSPTTVPATTPETTPSTATDGSTTPASGTPTSTGDSTASTAPGSSVAPEPADPTPFVSPPGADLAENTVTLAGDTDRSDDVACDTLYRLGPAFTTGEKAVDTASAEFVQGEWQVSLTLKTGAGGLDAWNDYASRCFSKAPECPDGGMAIVLDHEVISAPVPREQFFSDTRISVTGNFKQSEAKDLARVLNYGSNPVETKLLTSSKVSPTLGNDALRAAIIAGIIGVALVLALMLLYYRKLALVVVGGLVVSGGLLWTVIALLSRSDGLKLSLAGITGIIVSVGVTVDSYVVFFEKLKDEVRAGKTLRSSAQRGFKSAWRTIVAADIVSLLGAAVLWYLSSGQVRGFAFYLGLSTLCDLIVAYFFTRPAILLYARSKQSSARSVLGVKLGEAYAGGAA